MSTTPPETALGRPSRRIRSDGLFFAALVVIAATYVALIVLMLLADTAYVFTADMYRGEAIDFEFYPGEKTETPLQSGEVISNQFQRFGLSISASDGLTPMILDTSRPGNLTALGTPHMDFQGRGIGGGGGEKADEVQQNILPQRNVLILSTDRSQPEPAETGTLNFRWKDPVIVDRVHFLNLHQDGGFVATFDEQDNPITKVRLSAEGENSVQSIPLESEHDSRMKVSRMEVSLPCDAAITEIEFTWQGRVRSSWERENPGWAKLLYNPVTVSLQKPEIQYSIKLSLISCTITAILSLWASIPIGYLLSRYDFVGRNLVDAVLDIPIVLPPLVVGLSLLILFQFFPREAREAVVYQIPAVILAQFMVACAFAVRTMRATFDQIDPRREQVALTLGCSRAQAFLMVVLPEAKRGVMTAGTLAWARSLGEFGPLLIFAGATRFKTEVLSTTVFLEMSLGDLGAAVAVSLIMVAAAIVVLVFVRLLGGKNVTL